MWKDTTSYSRGERGTVEPGEWTAEAGYLRITIHKWHGIDGWFFSCHALSIERRALKATMPDAARGEALASVEQHLVRMTAAAARIRAVTP